MAKNRMFIRCKTCGNYVQIATMCGGYPYAVYTHPEKIQEIQEFFTKHYICTEEEISKRLDISPPFKYEDVNIENNFEIAYEAIN